MQSTKRRENKRRDSYNKILIQRGSYQPPSAIQVARHIQIDRELTTKILPKLIKEPIVNIYGFMQNLTGFHVDFEERYRERVVINYGFHEALCRSVCSPIPPFCTLVIASDIH